MVPRLVSDDERTFAAKVAPVSVPAGAVPEMLPVKFPVKLPVPVVKKRLVVEAVVNVPLVAKRLVEVAWVEVERSKKAPPTTSNNELVVVAASPITRPILFPPLGRRAERFVVVANLSVLALATKVLQPNWPLLYV